MPCPLLGAPVSSSTSSHEAMMCLLAAPLPHVEARDRGCAGNGTRQFSCSSSHACTVIRAACTKFRGRSRESGKIVQSRCYPGTVRVSDSPDKAPSGAEAEAPESTRLCSGVRVQHKPLPIRSLHLEVPALSTRVWRVQKVSGCRNRLFALRAQSWVRGRRRIRSALIVVGTRRPLTGRM